MSAEDELEAALEAATLEPKREDARALAAEKTGVRGKAGERIPLHSGLKILGQGGIGVELFFRTLRYSILLLLLFAAIGAISLSDNYALNLADGSYPAGAVLLASIGPCCRRTASQLTLRHAVPFGLTFVLMQAYLYLVRYKQRTVAQKHDEQNETASDYAVQVRSIPRAEASEEELAEFFSEYGKVERVTVSHACADLVKLLDEWKELEVDWHEALRKHLKLLRELHADDIAEEAKESEEKVAELEEKLLAREEQMAAAREDALATPTGTAFVVFSLESAKQKCVAAHHLSPLATFFNPLFNCLFSCCSDVPCIKVRRYHGVRLAARASPEPSDVNWANLEVSEYSTALRSGLTTAVTLAMLGASAALLSEITVAKKIELELDQEFDGGNNAVFISIGVAGVVTVINTLITTAVGHLTIFERRSTGTEYEESLYFKLASAYVINSVLLVLIVEEDPSTWADEGGVFSQAVFIAIGAVSPELLKVVPLGVWVNRLVMPFFTSSQQKLNALYEPPAFPLGNYYADLTKTLAIALVFGPAMPIIWFITLGTLCISFLANKFAVLRVAKPPPQMDVDLSEEFRGILSLVLLASGFVMSVVLAVSRNGGEDFEEESLFVLVLVVWIICFITPSSFFSCLRKYQNLGPAGGDESEVPYGEVVGIESYVDPASQPLPSIKAEQENYVRLKEALMRKALQDKE